MRQSNWQHRTSHRTYQDGQSWRSAATYAEATTQNTTGSTIETQVFNQDYRFFQVTPDGIVTVIQGCSSYASARSSSF
jgi:hypothetical protein